jgi:hypothetical protein
MWRSIFRPYRRSVDEVAVIYRALIAIHGEGAAEAARKLAASVPKSQRPVLDVVVEILDPARAFSGQAGPPAPRKKALSLEKRARPGGRTASRKSA